MPNRISANGADEQPIKGLRRNERHHLGFGFRPAQFGQDIGIEQPTRHNVTSRTTGRLDIQVAIGRGLYGGDQRFAGPFAFRRRNSSAGITTT